MLNRKIMNRIVNILILILIVNSCKLNKGEEVKFHQFSPSNSMEALTCLKQGNHRFVHDSICNTDYKVQIENTQEGQHPFAFVLSCIDSRVPPEIIFDQGIGNIFVARVAGNIHDDYILGSMEYAVEAKHCKLIVVMGHSHCGAVKGAMNNVKMGHLTEMADKIKPSLDTRGLVRSFYEEHTDEMTRSNVIRTIKDITGESSIIKEHLDRGQIAIVAAFYNINNGKVDFFDYEL